MGESPVIKQSPVPAKVISPEKVLTPVQSPAVIKVGAPQTFSFYEILKSVTIGKKITKLEWNNKEIYGVLKDTLLQLHKDDGFHTWILNEGDLVGTDWITL